jgi:acyl carrier protein
MGHRIELGEIEAIVDLTEGVSMACCVFDSDKDRINLYYVGTTEERELLETLKDKLPRYMLPNRVRKLETIAPYRKRQAGQSDTQKYEIINCEDLNMEELLEILNDMHPDVDFETATNLVDDRILDSLDIVSLISEIDDQFDVVIPPEEIVPENFNSAEALYELICRLDEE